MLKYYIIITLVVFFVFLYSSYQAKKNQKANLRRKIRENWDNELTREYDTDEIEKIASYFYHCANDDFYVDDITWNDLDLDSIFCKLNNTYSSSGEEYLYKLLRMPEFDLKILKDRDKLITFFENNKDMAFEIQEVFSKLGRTKKISLTDFLNRFTELGKRSSISHIIEAILMLASILLLFVYPIPGMILLFTMLVINIGTYYKEKAKIESYFLCLKYLIDMVNCGNLLVKKYKDNKENELSEYIDDIETSLKNTKKMCSGMFLISINGTGGSLGEIIMEYIRMIFHVDIIKFNSVLELVKTHTADIDKLFCTFGNIESCMAIASFRAKTKLKCKPVFCGENDLLAEEVYHPLINEPVTNTIETKSSVLITGSNASGKSTFLKTMAINILFAQTIYTCTAKSFKTNFYHLYSSMSLRDSLKNNESYYMVEIKSIKRIVDAVKRGENVFSFVDEVLRGTNTIERIAASSEILKEIDTENSICFAATHDIELTHILDNIYVNYHFKEDVACDDILFNYKLLNGRSDSRNAIKLLKIIGFEDKIVKNAENFALELIKNGQP